jgi:hypothetical protein
VASLSHMVGARPVLVQLIFYDFAGIVWIMPVNPLLLWMETGRWRVPKG